MDAVDNAVRFDTFGDPVTLPPVDAVTVTVDPKMVDQIEEADARLACNRQICGTNFNAVHNNVWMKLCNGNETDFCQLHSNIIYKFAASCYTDQQYACYKHCCTSACFPGEALAEVQSQGQVPLADIHAGDRVLVETVRGELVFEPVLAFLHATHRQHERTQFLTVTHTNGEFRATATHIIFVVDPLTGRRSDKPLGDVQVGDTILIVDNPQSTSSSSRAKPSEVLKIHASTGHRGYFAPLTKSGTIAVDGVIASNYATPSLHSSLPHNLAHAALFPVRAYHSLGLAAITEWIWSPLCNAIPSIAWLCQGGGIDTHLDEHVDELHPWIYILTQYLMLDRLLTTK